MDLFSFFIGAGSVSVGYLVCSIIVDVIREHQHKKYKIAQDLNTKIAIENANIEGMRTEIKNLRGAYTSLSIKLDSIENKLNTKTKTKR